MKESEKIKHVLDLNFNTKEGKSFDIPIQGSLGLLALGDIGLVAWREKKKQVQEQLQKRKNS